MKVEAEKGHSVSLHTKEAEQEDHRLLNWKATSWCSVSAHFNTDRVCFCLNCYTLCMFLMYFREQMDLCACGNSVAISRCPAVRLLISKEPMKQEVLHASYQLEQFCQVKLGSNQSQSFILTYMKSNAYELVIVSDMWTKRHGNITSSHHGCY